MHYPCREEIVEFTINNTAREIKQMVNKINKHAPGKVKFCYEVGVDDRTTPGSRLYAHRAIGCDCDHIAADCPACPRPA
jgi:hypothetical protein